MLHKTVPLPTRARLAKQTQQKPRRHATLESSHIPVRKPDRETQHPNRTPARKRCLILRTKPRRRIGDRNSQNFMTAKHSTLHLSLQNPTGHVFDAKTRHQNNDLKANPEREQPHVLLTIAPQGVSNKTDQKSHLDHSVDYAADTCHEPNPITAGGNNATATLYARNPNTPRAQQAHLGQ